MSRTSRFHRNLIIVVVATLTAGVAACSANTPGTPSGPDEATGSATIPSTSTPGGDAPTPDDDAPRTEVVGIRIVTSDGSPRPDLEVRPDGHPMECAYSPSTAIDGSAVTCLSPRTDYRMAFCVAGANSKAYCVSSGDDPATPRIIEFELLRITEDGAVTAPEPLPYAIELTDGTVCAYAPSVHGARRPDFEYARFSCGDPSVVDRRRGVYLWSTDPAVPFDRSRPRWLAMTGRMAGPTRVVEVAKAYFLDATRA